MNGLKLPLLVIIMEPNYTLVMIVWIITAISATLMERKRSWWMNVTHVDETTAKTVRRWLLVLVVQKKSVMIVTNINVSDAMMISVRSVLMKANLSANVTTAIIAIVGHAMAMTIQQLILFTRAVDAISNVAMIAGSNGIGRDSCTAALRRYQTECVGSRTWSM